MSTIPLAHNLERRLFFAGVFFYVIIFFIYFPVIFAFRDESSYLSVAYTLRQGTFFADRAGVPDNYFLHYLGHWVPIYPLGNPTALLLFTFFNWRACFLLGLLCHLVGTFTFVKLLRLCGTQNVFWGLLYLFFPGFVFFSRTLMSDIPSATFFLLGIYFYFKYEKNLLWAGVFWGLSLTFRITNVVALTPFLCKILWDSIRDRTFKRCWTVSLGIIFFGGAILIQNHFYYGSPFLFGVSPQFNGVRNFSLDYIFGNISHYAKSLNLAYPLMLLSLLSLRGIKRFTAWWVSTILLIFFYQLYYFHDHFPGELVTLVFANRYLFPVIPYLLLIYASWLDSFSASWPSAIRTTVMILVFISLAATNFMIQRTHQQALNRQLALKNIIYQNTSEGSVLIYDYNSTELLQREWGIRDYINGAYDDLEKILSDIPSSKSIYLVTRDLAPNQPGAESDLRTRLKEIENLWHATPLAAADGVTLFRLDQNSNKF